MNIGVDNDRVGACVYAAQMPAVLWGHTMGMLQGGAPAGAPAFGLNWLKMLGESDDKGVFVRRRNSRAHYVVTLTENTSDSESGTGSKSRTLSRISQERPS